MIRTRMEAKNVIVAICCLFSLTCSGLVLLSDDERTRVPAVQAPKLAASHGGKDEAGKPKAEKRAKWEHDKKFSVRYALSSDSWKSRYGSREVPFEGWMTSWKGGRRMTGKQIETLARLVFKRLPHIRTTPALLSLVVETAIAESDGGRIVKNRYGDYGAFQMKPWVAKETLAWLREHHKDVYAAVMDLRDKRLNEKDNLVGNLPYAAAMCVTYYWRRAGDGGLRGGTQTMKDRAVMWKSLYNTRKGYGTVAAYVDRNRNYVAK